VIVYFEVIGAPRGKGRPKFARRGKHTHVYSDDKTVAYETLIANEAKIAMAGLSPLSEPLELGLTVYVEPVASCSRKARESMLSGATWPAKKPDLDNVVKAVLDACNGITFVDDALVVRIRAEKKYAAIGRVAVTLQGVDEF